MKVKIRTIKEFRFTMTEREFSVLQDALYEHSIGNASEEARACAEYMRNRLNEALRSL